MDDRGGWGSDGLLFVNWSYHGHRVLRSWSMGNIY